MKRRILGEYWDYLDFWHPESYHFRVRFRCKKALFSPRYVSKPPFQCLQKMKKHPLFAHSSATPFCTLIFATKTSLPSPIKAKRHPGSPFSRPNTHEICTHFPRSPHHSPLAHVLFPPPCMYENPLKDVSF